MWLSIQCCTFSDRLRRIDMKLLFQHIRQNCRGRISRGLEAYFGCIFRFVRLMHIARVYVCTDSWWNLKINPFFVRTFTVVASGYFDEVNLCVFSVLKCHQSKHLPISIEIALKCDESTIRNLDLSNLLKKSQYFQNVQLLQIALFRWVGKKKPWFFKTIVLSRASRSIFFEFINFGFFHAI